MSYRILMTGAGAPGAPGILKCLKDEDLDIYTADCRNNAVGKFLNEDPEKFTLIPKAGSSNFIDEVLTLCLEKKINVVLPLVTAELPIFSRYKFKFDLHNIKVLVSDEISLATANDKGKLYDFFHSGCPELLPEYQIVNDFRDVKGAFERLGHPMQDICVKPCVSNGSRGFRIISSHIDDFDLFFNHKPSSTYIKAENLLSLLERNKFPELLFSEFLPGDEYSVDCLAVNGSCKLVIPRIRTRMIGGISVEGEILNITDLIDSSRQVVESLKLNGNIGVQFKRNKNGEFKLLEINPRVQGTIVAALGAGVNLPLLAVKVALGEDIDWNKINVKWNTKFCRYWNEVYYV